MVSPSFVHSSPESLVLTPVVPPRPVAVSAPVVHPRLAASHPGMGGAADGGVAGGVAVSAGASPPRRTILGCGHVRAGDRAVVGEVDVRATASDTAPPHQQKICVRSPARLGAAALPAGSIRPAQPKRRWLAVGMVAGVDVDEMDDLQYRQFQQRDGDQQRREFQHDLGDVDLHRRSRRRLSDGGPGAVVSTSVVDLVHATSVVR